MPRDLHPSSFSYADRFADAAPSLPGQHLPWLRDLRTAAIERVRRLGLPTSRAERWKYTNLNVLNAVAFTPAGSAPAAASDSLPNASGNYHFVLVDGRHRPELSTVTPPLGLSISSLSRLLQDDPEAARLLLAGHVDGEDALDALNLAFAADGYVIHAAAGAKIETPIEIVHVNSTGLAATAIHTRNVVIADAGSSAAIVESFVGGADAAYWSHAVCDIKVAPGAVVHRYKDQDDGIKAFHIAADRVSVARDARYESFVLATGAALSRHEIALTLDGSGASCQLDGGYLARGRQHVDNTTEIRHAQPQTTSSEVYKGVLDGQARGVFQGRIVVEKDAQKSNGHQLSKTILLSDRAEIDTKPELEIFADDVKCSHGATAGELDGDALFYLRARGIDLAEARRLLVEAFIHDALANVTDATVRGAFERRIGSWMARSSEDRTE